MERDMRITVRGVVQGVGFRPTVHRLARSMGLHGYVQNNGSNVVIEIDGDAEVFVRRLKEALPPLARLDEVAISEGLSDPDLKAWDSGSCRASGHQGRGHPQRHRCLRLLPEGDVRSLRQALSLPFHQLHRLRRPFHRDRGPSVRSGEDVHETVPALPQCQREYGDPDDRRFHHQTVTCPVCGPRYYLLDRDGRRHDERPIADFASRLHEGDIGVAKSWGGMHLCCTLDQLPHMREWYRRKEKPFAIMVRDLKALERYGRPTAHDQELLTSSHRPIVLVSKVDNAVTELVAPGLDTIGVFLPYTSMQHLLFHHLEEDALVMTSANVPGEPMVLRELDALTLGADMYLMHDRR